MVLPEDQPLSMKITGQTLRIKGRLDQRAAELFYMIHVDEIRRLKFLNLSDVSRLYADGFLPICARLLSMNKTLKIRCDNNAGVHRILDFYGYRDLVTVGGLTDNLRIRQRIRQFTKEGETEPYIAASFDEIERRVSCGRDVAEAFEWSIGELIGNVFHHSESKIGTLVQFLLQHQSELVKFALVDTGIGLLATIQRAFPNVSTSQEAIQYAIRRGVTSNPENQGWGLFGSTELVRLSQGSFRLWTGDALLFIDPRGNYHYRAAPRFEGVAIEWQLPYRRDVDLKAALQSRDVISVSLLRYEDPSSGASLLKLQAESQSFTDRAIGRQIKNKLLNLIKSSPEGRCIVDFANVRVVSSSFADECFGKLAVRLQPNFSRHVSFRNMSATNQAIVEAAVAERLRVSPR